MNLVDRNISYWPRAGVNLWGVPKCGTTAMKHYLYERECGKPFEGPEMNIHSACEYITPEEANSNGLRNWGTVREPVERFMSIWKDLCVKRPERGRDAGISPCWTPEELARFLWLESAEDVHLLPQWEFLSDANNLLPVLAGKFCVRKNVSGCIEVPLTSKTFEYVTSEYFVDYPNYYKALYGNCYE